MRAKAGRTLTVFSDRLQSIPIALPEMASGLLSYHHPPTQVKWSIFSLPFLIVLLSSQVFIAGQTEDNHTQALIDVLRSRFIPGRILAVADGPGGRAGLLYSRLETMARLTPIQGKSAAYVCRNFTCSLPVTEPDDLACSLDDHDGHSSGEEN